MEEPVKRMKSNVNYIKKMTQIPRFLDAKNFLASGYSPANNSSSVIIVDDNITMSSSDSKFSKINNTTALLQFNESRSNEDPISISLSAPEMVDGLYFNYFENNIGEQILSGYSLGYNFHMKYNNIYKAVYSSIKCEQTNGVFINGTEYAYDYEDNCYIYHVLFCYTVLKSLGAIEKGIIYGNNINDSDLYYNGDKVNTKAINLNLGSYHSSFLVGTKRKIGDTFKARAYMIFNNNGKKEIIYSKIVTQYLHEI